ncbi:hypothetical protein OSSY52_01430 [Tepiditoga spiralis]|uniref:Nucleotide kinase n=1 Tax=Tepiditoga spiralis TaxID=2108365 RepID=A0A7G1G7K7_9BACT|nr:nucleoside-triphosphatase [Tepiditoga spiralis]BBE30002.1 hypothetical protein OSSY52_01430 [Tepiditoga spiralis]
MVNIISGEINSGKTTKLINIFKTTGGDGFAAIKVYKNNEFYGYNLTRLSNNEIIPFISIDKFDDELFKLSRFSFSKKGFIFANKIIDETLINKKTLYIDEIGPLELSKKGFYTSFKKALKKNIEIYVCIRSSCIQNVIKEFKIKNYKIITEVIK